MRTDDGACQPGGLPGPSPLASYRPSLHSNRLANVPWNSFSVLREEETERGSERKTGREGVRERRRGGKARVRESEREIEGVREIQGEGRVRGRLRE